MKFLIFFLFIASFAHSQLTNANFERKFAEVYDKEYLEVTVKYSNQISVFWKGYVDYIIIKSDNGIDFSVINCEKTSQLNLSNLFKGTYYLNFYTDDKLVCSEKITKT